MAKDPASTRIPRLDGASKIPQPGYLRPPLTNAIRPSQILRPASTFLAPRTTSLSGLRPPTSLSQNLLKKSSSGDRINNAYNMMSKKTTSALKKFFSKPEKPATPLQQTPVRKAEPMNLVTPCSRIDFETLDTKFISSTPHTLIRSDTFVRSEGKQQDMLGVTHGLIDSSTPKTQEKQLSCEHTRLLPSSTRHALYTTQAVDRTPKLQLCENLMLNTTSTQSLQRTHTLDNTRTSVVGFGRTLDLDSPKAIKDLNDTQVLGNTMTLSAPRGSTFNATKADKLEKQATFDLTKVVIDHTQLIDNLPATSKTGEDTEFRDDLSMPHECDYNVTLTPHDAADEPYRHLMELTTENLEDTLPVLEPDKATMMLPLNSTKNKERLLDLTENIPTPPRHMQLLNLTRDFMELPISGTKSKNNSQLLYMTHLSSTSSTPDRFSKLGEGGDVQYTHQHTPLPTKLMSPLILKGAKSELLLPIRTPDEELLSEPMEVDTTLTSFAARHDEFYALEQQQHFLPQQQQQISSAAVSLQELNNAGSGKQKSRFSFGLDLTESTLDCSIELCDISLSSTVLSQPAAAISVLGSNMTLSPTSHSQQLLKKQNSFEMDESLGILTPDQMKEFLDSTNTTNTNNLELPLNASHNNIVGNNNQKMSFHAMRFDQTPSPEELPLDPVEVKTDIADMVLAQQQQQLAAFSAASAQQQRTQLQSCSLSTEPTSVSCDTELSKADPMTKSSVSKISTSFITSVTSVTSLDTGYQGDGEMSRPASRGAGDHSPSNGPAQRKCGHVSRQPSFNQQQLQAQQQPPIRRQDPMTDSDFFTESDADDVYHRGDRRAQVIDGQLYGPMLQHASASVFITEDPQMEDSCMESSGIFTDVENRCDDDLALLRNQDTQDVDMSPDGDSTDTVKSNRAGTKRITAQNENESDSMQSHGQGQHSQQQQQQQQLQLSDSQTSSTMQSSFSNDRISMTTEAAGTTLSNRTSYCSVDDAGGSNAMHVDCKSFGSLEEAFAPGVEAPKSFGDGKSLTSATSTNSALASVAHKGSPRKHSSLTSLCTINGVHASSSQTSVSAAKHAKTSSSSSKCSTIDTNKVSVNGRETDAKVLSTPSSRASPRFKTSPAIETTVGASVSPTNSTSSSNFRKTQPPNKWDAVMNKIASNKLLMKKNYNDVKSKVSTGVIGAGGGGAPAAPTATNVRRSPSCVSVGRASLSVAKVLSSKNAATNNLPTDTGSGLQSPQAKRLLQSAPKRGRSNSKDSQKSSQSDLSLSSGSPKLLAKTPLRAAKKRDVRNLSISPTDLGPPPKTQQTANGATTRAKPTNVSLTQKRAPHSSAVVPASATSTTPSTPAGSNVGFKSSSPNKKFSLLSTRRLEAKPTAAPIKSPLKDHNRVITEPAQQQQSATTPTNNKNGNALINGDTTSNSSKPQTPTENHENVNGVQQHQHHKNSNNNNVTSARSSSQTPSPILSQQHGKKTNSTSATTNTLDKKTAASKLQPSNRKLLHKQQRSSEEAVTPEPLGSLELQQLKHLNRHSCNGRLDYQSLEQHLQQTAEAQELQHKGIEAMGVLLQYLVFDLDAFACPGVKNEKTKAKDSLTKTLNLLDEAKSACSELQDQLCDKEVYYAQREEELQALHRSELEKVQSNLAQTQLRASEQISALKSELLLKDTELKRSLDSYRLEMDKKLAQKQQHIQYAEQREKALLERISVLEKTEYNLNMQFQTAEESCAQRVQLATQREQELLEKLRVLNKELDVVRETKEHSERELKDKLNLSQDEISVLRTSSRRSLNHESMERGGSSPRNSSSGAVAAAMEITRLQSEAESLRCVLELKQKEISKLTKQNEELMRDADERVALQAKISLLESRIEMLQSELEIKTDKEKEYQRQVDDIQKAFNHETVKRTRLSYDNEALQWQLKQRSEQLHIVEAKLQELSSQDLQTSQNSSLISMNRSSQNGTSIANFQTEDGSSPPPSPIIKAVIEKTDSVSWVLEMDDDTPEVAASKMVNRAGSFRSVERSPSTRRQLSVSANAATSASNTSNGASGPNPLSQSMSAASVIRQHSNETAEFLGRANSRIRSKSVSVKGPEPTTASKSKNNKKLLRQTSAGNTRKNELQPPTWKDPISSSSPYVGIRPRSSTMKSGIEQEDAFCSRSSRILITCDTSALNSGERLELRGLPTHPSVQDLKVHKKSQQIQESAGEAMVSGTNSEDEGCSHSSDEVVSSSTTSTSSAASATSGSSLSLNNLKNHPHMSLEEEVLLLDKINSLNGTPMEVSWSDETDAFVHNGSIV